MSKAFELEFSFVEKWGRLASAEDFRIYIYILSCFRKNGKILKEEEIAKKLRISPDAVADAIDFWITAEVLEKDGCGYCFPDMDSSSKIVDLEKPKKGSKKSQTSERLRTRPSYASAEIDAAASVNDSVDYLFKQAEIILDKILSPSDFEMIYSFVDWLGLPVEVVIMLLQFGARQGKTGKRYLETVAIDWADKGIDTYESAEEYIREIELKLSNEGKVRGILGIYDRALTQTEKKYIGLWVGEKKISPELIAAAYDRTVAATGKLSWAYMNKILESWKEQCFETVEQVRANEEMFKIKNSPTKKKENGKKSKFNNYEDTNKPDYSNFAEEILSDMLEE
ncbi:MAG: DnaD domain protein [Ruminococcaceae bacterium]|nr:DnaD domain protein [Oscillospiraceae bacterium]